MIFKLRFKAGFGHFTQTHKGFGPTIYTEETIEYESSKDYFDFVEFFKKYAHPEDTYFHILWMEDRELNAKELASFEKYEQIRQAHCQAARDRYIDTMDIEPEFTNPQGD